MAEITIMMKAAYGAIPHMVPAEVRAQIDTSELFDRLVYAEYLLKRGAEQRDPAVAAGWRNEARAVLTARPRDEAEGAVLAARRRASMFEKNAMPVQAEQAWRHTRDVQGADRPAPERTWSLYYGSNPSHDAARAELRKGAKPVFDAAGHLLGVAHPSRITPSASK